MRCQLYTTRVQYGALIEREHGLPVLDVTVKGVDFWIAHHAELARRWEQWRLLGAAFAPTWEMVNGYKGGKLSEESYRQQYLAMMRQTYQQQWWAWEWVLLQPRVALACYCHQEDFCHRFVLVELLQKVAAQDEAIELVYEGELEKPKVKRVEQQVLLDVPVQARMW